MYLITFNQRGSTAPIKTLTVEDPVQWVTDNPNSCLTMCVPIQAAVVPELAEPEPLDHTTQAELNKIKKAEGKKKGK